MPQQAEKHFSPRTTNILLVSSVAILIASVLIRYLAPATWDTAITEWSTSMGWEFQTQPVVFGLQHVVLTIMGVGVFLFLLGAFDQPE